MREKRFNAQVRSKGFTLVELLVTISILAVLMTIAMMSFQNLQKNGRDNKRKSDISTIQSRLEHYRADQGFYPTGVPTSGPLTNKIGLTPTPVILKTYIDKIPGETQAGIAAYTYAKYPSTCTNIVSNPSTYCINYCLYANLENSDNASSATTICTALNIAATSRYQTQAP